MIASLPMYARDSNRVAHDALWTLIRDGLRARGVSAPDQLDHQIDHMASWAHPDLVLGQICNLPLRGPFAGKVTVIGTAHYDLPNCVAGFYNSLYIARPDGPKSPRDCVGHRFACNDLLSQSGYGAAQNWAAEQGHPFDPPLITGSHRASIAAVADGKVDFATIDAQTWRIECAENPKTKDVSVIGRTDSTPGMTFITRLGEDPAPYFAAIADAIKDLPKDIQAQLNLYGIVMLSKAAYDIPLPPEPQSIPA